MPHESPSEEHELSRNRLSAGMSAVDRLLVRNQQVKPVMDLLAADEREIDAFAQATDSTE